ncbi:MAG: hypothetical protein AAF802_12340 [Planctomycetota bacterium]
MNLGEPPGRRLAFTYRIETALLDFEPFPVVCVTCGSKLRVNRRELVDAIVKCPKCQSLVQLSRSTTEAPPQPVALGDLSVDTGAVTEDSIAAPASDSASDLATTSNAAPPVFESPKFEEPPPAQRSAESFEDAPPPANWQATGTAKTRRIASIVAASVIGLFALVVLVTVVVRGGGSGTQASIADPESVDASVDADPQEGVTQDTEPEDPAADEEVTTGESTDSPEAQTETDVDASSGEMDSNSTDTAADTNRTETVESIPEDLLPTNPLLPDNPLLSDMMRPDRGTAESEDDLSQDIAKLTELPPELADLFNRMSDLERAQFPNAAPPPPTIDEFEVDQAAKVQVDGERQIDAPKPINMREALGLKVALQAGNPQGYPLHDLLMRISQLSGVPIEVQWVSMDFVGVALNERVKLPQGWLSLEEVLESVCQSTGCIYEAKPSSIEFRPNDDTFAARLAELIDLSDLNSPQAVLSARRLLGQHDSRSDGVDVPEKLGRQQIAAFACEAIRRLNGGTGKMDDAAFRRWAGPVSEQVEGWPLLKDSPIGGEDSGRQLVQAASVTSLLVRFAKSKDATCFVNWSDAAKSGLRPIDHKMPHTGPDVPIAQAVDQLLEGSYLQARHVDDGSWWVGSQATYDRFPVIVWLGEDAKSDSERTRQLIRSMIEGAGAEGSVTVDATSGQCIAILPRFLVRQVPRLLSGESENP